MNIGNILVINPGVVLTESDSFVPSVDAAVLFENDAKEWPVDFDPWPEGTRSVMVHTANQDFALKVVKDRDVDWVFVTDMIMPNPYDGSATHEAGFAEFW